MQTNKKKNNLINTLINISILLCDCCKGNDLQFPYAYAYINIHTHVYSHTYTLRIAKIHIQIQKCASFNNKLHNFNLLTHKSATTTAEQPERNGIGKRGIGHTYPPSAVNALSSRAQEYE